MINESVTIDGAVILLNEMIALDKGAIAALLTNRIPCNEHLANHATIQVIAKNDGYSVGLLGVINGLFGIDKKGYGAIAAIYETKPNNQIGNLIRFTKLEGE